MITAKIDVLKIDKARLFKGEKGTYLDIALIETPNDEYGNDYMIVQSVTKEEREAGKRGTILGNAKIRGGGASSKPKAEPAKATTTMNKPKAENLDEDVPF